MRRKGRPTACGLSNVHCKARSPAAVVRYDRSVPRDRDGEMVIALVADLDDLIAYIRIHPLAVVQILLRVVRIEALDVEILNVGRRVGHAPGDMFIVTNDDKRQPGKADAGYIESGRLEMNHVPDAGDAVAEMGIVRQQRLTGFRVRSIHNPVIAPQSACGRFHSRSRKNRHRQMKAVGKASLTRLVALLFSQPSGAEGGTSATGTSSAEWSGNTSETRSFPNLAAICSRIKSVSQLWLSAVARFKATATESISRQGWGWYRNSRNSKGRRSRWLSMKALTPRAYESRRRRSSGERSASAVPPPVESPACRFP